MGAVLRMIGYVAAWLTVPFAMFGRSRWNYGRVFASYCFWSLVGIALPPLAAVVLALTVRDFRRAGRDVEKARGLGIPRAEQMRERARWAGVFACVCLAVGLGLWTLVACGVIRL